MNKQGIGNTNNEAASPIPFEELEDEPGYEPTRLQQQHSSLSSSKRDRNTSVLTEEVSPTRNITPSKSVMRRQQVPDSSSSVEHKSSYSSNPTSIKPKVSSTASGNHLTSSILRSRYSVSSGEERRSQIHSNSNRYGSAPCPETPTFKRHTSINNKFATPTTDLSGYTTALAETVEGANNSITTPPTVQVSSSNHYADEVRSPPPPPLSSISIPSQSSSNLISESQQCQSVAQSTLNILLARIDEAKMNFSQAIHDGNVEKQLELGELISKLGEAAVAMRKLEQ